MTNEKTIEILKELWRYSETDKYSESEIRKAIKIAIKAVEAVDYDCADCKWYLEVKKNEMSKEDRKVTYGDLIQRQAVITMLNKIENAIEDGDGFQFNEWIEYAKDIPSAKNCKRRKMSKYIDVEIAKECFEPSDLDGDCFDNYDNVIRILNAVQTEDVTPIVRGKWINRGDMNDGECSVCKKLIRAADSANFKYCPNCGAKMDGKEE